ncbi:MAG: BON domain-containing protein [Rhodospirillales bacterium]|nr:BON domain-containing protein [Rhodospirillales bacterium]
MEPRVRSDDRIREDVCDRLMEDPHFDASAIDVRVENGDVTLNGAVDSRRARRRAEDLAERVGGVKNVYSGLRVTHRPGHGGAF